MLALLTTIRNHVRGPRSPMVIGEADAEAIPLERLGLDQRSYLGASVPMGESEQSQPGMRFERGQPELDIFDRWEIAQHVQADRVHPMPVGKLFQFDPQARVQFGIDVPALSKRHVVAEANRQLLARGRTGLSL